MQFEFTHELVSADVETGTLEVRYIPLDPQLSMIPLNINVIKSDVEDATFDDHYELTINSFAPHYMWERQQFLIEFADELQQKITD
jgi:hypothetical protein